MSQERKTSFLVYYSKNVCVSRVTNLHFSIDVFHKREETALIIAAEEGHNQIVVALLNRCKCKGCKHKNCKCKPKVDAQDNNGETSLMKAAENGNTEIVQTLLEHGATADIFNKRKGDSALMMASEDGHIEIISALLQNGANVDAVSYKSETALMEAIKAKSNRNEAVALFLENNANLDIQSNGTRHRGWTALMRAAQSGESDVVSALLKAGAAVDLKTHDGETALILAAKG